MKAVDCIAYLDPGTGTGRPVMKVKLSHWTWSLWGGFRVLLLFRGRSQMTSSPYWGGGLQIMREGRRGQGCKSRGDGGIQPPNNFDFSKKNKGYQKILQEIYRKTWIFWHHPPISKNSPK